MQPLAQQSSVQHHLSGAQVWPCFLLKFIGSFKVPLDQASVKSHSVVQLIIYKGKGYAYLSMALMVISISMDLKHVAGKNPAPWDA